MISLKTGLVAGLFFPLSCAFATTFGPLPVYKQAENTQYYVHARVLTNGSSALEPTLQKPYTYWTIDVSEQLQGSPLPSQFSIREPGGEVGDFGYHVAATAEFTAGEDVYIALHDTPQEGVKEVVGLASGKFTVVPGKDGKPIVQSGLGVPVSGDDGVPLSPEEFGNLLHRISRGQATAADKTIFVSHKPLHDDDIPASSHSSAPPKATAARTSETVADAAPAPVKMAGNVIPAPPNALQQSSPTTEENTTGSSSSWGWLVAVGALVGLILGLYFLLR